VHIHTCSAIEPTMGSSIVILVLCMLVFVWLLILNSAARNQKIRRDSSTRRLPYGPGVEERTAIGARSLMSFAHGMEDEEPSFPK